MFCESCGTKYSEKQAFCEKCGQKLPGASFVFDDNKETKANEGQVGTQNIATTPESTNTEVNTIKEPIPKISQPISQSSPAINNQVTQVNNNGHTKGNLGIIKFLFVEIIVFAAMIYFLVPYILGNFSAEHKAEQFFASLANRDYEKVYDLYNIDSKDERNFMLNKDDLRKYRASMDLKEVLNFKVNKDETFNSDENRDEIRKEVVISYTNRGDSSERYFTVNMVKEPGKKYFIFDNWSVDYASVTASDVKIKVVEDATVKVDGVEIPKKYMEKVEEDASNVYTIPIIFAGKHKIEVSKQDLETLKRTERMSGSEEFNYLHSMRISNELAEKLRELAITNIKLIYFAALNGEPFDKIKNIFVPDNEILNSVQSSYNELVQSFNSDNKKIKKIDFTGARTEADKIETVVSKNIHYRVYFSYYYSPWFSDSEWRDKENIGEFYEETAFKLVDGKWLQTNFGCKTLDLYAY